MRTTLASFAIGISLVSTSLAASAQTPGKSDPDEIVCKREKKVNSRFTTKTCLTRAQWNEIAEANKRDYAENQSRHNIVIRRDE